MADNWKEKIEAQIAWLKADLEPHGGELNDHEKAVVAAIISMQALYDVAVEAENVIRGSTIIFPNTAHSRLQDALNSCIDKLREVGDGRWTRQDGNGPG